MLNGIQKFTIDTGKILAQQKGWTFKLVVSV